MKIKRDKLEEIVKEELEGFYEARASDVGGSQAAGVEARERIYGTDFSPMEEIMSIVLAKGKDPTKTRLNQLRAEFARAKAELVRFETGKDKIADLDKITNIKKKIEDIKDELEALGFMPQEDAEG